MKQLLYLEDNYINDFETRVSTVNLNKGYLVLEQTAFHPQGGHQEADTGIIEKGEQVCEVTSVKSAEGLILHFVSNKNQLYNILPGDFVKGKVNWDRRYKLMKTHTAQHLLSALAKKLFNLESMDMEIAVERGSIKFNSNISGQEAAALQAEANAAVKLNPPVIRVSNNGVYTVNIGDVDSRKCGCTHVKQLKEIEEIYIYEIDGARIFYHVGKAAKDRAINDQGEVLRVQEQFKTSLNKLGESYNLLNYSQKEKDVRFSKLAGELLTLELKNKNHEYSSKIEDLSIVQREELSINEINQIVKGYLANNQKTIIVLGKNNTALVFSNKSTVSAEKIARVFKFNCESYKGGGNANYSQGGPWIKSIQETYDIVESAILEVSAYCD